MPTKRMVMVATSKVLRICPPHETERDCFFPGDDSSFPLSSSIFDTSFDAGVASATHSRQYEGTRSVPIPLTTESVVVTPTAISGCPRRMKDVNAQ
jgi:hypothetical protein